ncbi:MAG: VWA domain-containing protein [Acidobacteria bacterium]|nr:VWA domain-containing protein [Acidobacteriota bacterium]
MTNIVRTLAGALLAAAAVALSASAQQPVFRTGARMVSVYSTVTDARGRLVPELTKDDFEILDNQQPQPIALFDASIQPVTVVVMLDTSASMTAHLDLLRAAASQFFIRLLPADKARVGAFNDKIQISARFTSDRDDLIGELAGLDYGNPTRLYDAIAVGLDALKNIEGRRVILVFTDGDDTASDISMGKIVDRARIEDVMIYSIGLQSEFFNGQRKVRSKPDRGLRKLAEETGGGYFELEKSDELCATFTRVAQELHSQYLLGFTPPTLDGKIHKLELRIRKAGMQVRARRSYLANPDVTTDAGNKPR